MNPRVKSVIACDDHKLKIVFTNGEKGVFDCSHLLDIGVFKELQDTAYFKQARVEYGTVTWPHEQDICPDTLYIESKNRRICRPDYVSGSSSRSRKTPARCSWRKSFRARLSV